VGEPDLGSAVRTFDAAADRAAIQMVHPVRTRVPSRVDASLAISRPVRQLLYFAEGREELEATAGVEIAKHILLACGLILAVGIITGLLSQKLGIPDVAVFLIAGVLIGPQVLGLIHVSAD